MWILLFEIDRFSTNSTYRLCSIYFLFIFLKRASMCSVTVWSIAFSHLYNPCTYFSMIKSPAKMQGFYRRKRKMKYLRRKDSNLRSSGYEPDKLPTALLRVAMPLAWWFSLAFGLYCIVKRIFRTKRTFFIKFHLFSNIHHESGSLHNLLFQNIQFHLQSEPMISAAHTAF